MKLFHEPNLRKVIYYLMYLLVVPLVAVAQGDSLTAFQTPLQKILDILTSGIAMTVVVIATVIIGIVIIVSGGQNVKSKLISLGGGGILIFSAQAIVNSLFN